MKVKLPLSIASPVFQGGHCQGAQVDVKKREVFFSFTTTFVRMDFDGKLIGSVDGLTAHLGCLARHPKTGRIYASLEYKNDEIGKGITNRLGVKSKAGAAFYAASFDPDKITGLCMTAEEAGMQAVYLKKVVDDYLHAPDNAPRHRYGCSGIDGITFAPMFGGEKSNELYMYVAYGIYGDVNRTDNDHQVLLALKEDALSRYEKPFIEDDMHTSGPDAPDDVLFAYTGNTTYGIQNLEYDMHTDSLLAAVYSGRKDAFPNFPMFLFDMAKAPEECKLSGLDERGKRVFLKE